MRHFIGACFLLIVTMGCALAQSQVKVSLIDDRHVSLGGFDALGGNAVVSLDLINSESVTVGVRSLGKGSIRKIVVHRRGGGRNVIRPRGNVVVIPLKIGRYRIDVRGRESSNSTSRISRIRTVRIRVVRSFPKHFESLTEPKLELVGDNQRGVLLEDLYSVLEGTNKRVVVQVPLGRSANLELHGQDFVKTVSVLDLSRISVGDYELRSRTFSKAGGRGYHGPLRSMRLKVRGNGQDQDRGRPKAIDPTPTSTASPSSTVQVTPTSVMTSTPVPTVLPESVETPTPFAVESPTPTVEPTATIALAPSPTFNPTPSISPPPSLSMLGKWESDMRTYGAALCERLLGNYSNFDQALVDTYYDAEWVFFQIADYTGDVSWLECAQAAEKIYRDGYVLPNNGNVPGYWTFTHGLTEDYLRTGDERSREAAIALSENAAFNRDATPLESTSDALLQREVAYAIMNYLNAELLGESRRARLSILVTQAIDHLAQQVESKPYGSKSFMVGLAAQALISYDEQVGDVRVLPALEAALGALWEHNWVPEAQAFRYDTSSLGTDLEPAPDLNQLIAPAFAWLYAKTGRELYRDRADLAFEGGVKFAWLGGGKQFNQNYRWSFAFLKWRQG